MIHLALGLFILALTCLVLTLGALASGGVDPSFAIGSVAAVAISGVLLWYVRRNRL